MQFLERETHSICSQARGAHSRSNLWNHIPKLNFSLSLRGSMRRISGVPCASNTTAPIQYCVHCPGLSITQQETTILLVLEKPLWVILRGDILQMLEILFPEAAENILLGSREARTDEVQVQALVLGYLLHRLHQLLVRLLDVRAAREVLGPLRGEDPPCNSISITLEILKSEKLGGLQHCDTFSSPIELPPRSSPAWTAAVARGWTV